jgi:ribonuclease HI
MEEGYMMVRIFILTNLNCPARVKYGVAMWLVEFLAMGETPITRQGFVHCENTTRFELSIKALINAFAKLKKPCTALIYCDEQTMLNAFGNSWFIQWRKDGWVNSRGKPIRYQRLWEMLVEEMEPHIYTMRGERHDYSDVMENDIRKETEKWQKALSSKGRTS